MKLEKQMFISVKANIIRMIIDLGKNKKLEYFVIKINDFNLKNQT